MIYLFISISAILIGYLFIQKKDNQTQSQLTECTICHDMFMDRDVFIEDDLPFCSNHRSTYLNSNWVVYKRAKSTPTESVDGVKLFEEKMALWKSFKIPAIIKSSYKTECDFIATELAMYIREEDFKKVSKTSLH